LLHFLAAMYESSMRKMKMFSTAKMKNTRNEYMYSLTRVSYVFSLSLCVCVCGRAESDLNLVNQTYG
jgi:hypothetical protein